MSVFYLSQSKWLMLPIDCHVLAQFSSKQNMSVKTCICSYCYTCIRVSSVEIVSFHLNLILNMDPTHRQASLLLCQIVLRFHRSGSECCVEHRHECKGLSSVCSSTFFFFFHSGKCISVCGELAVGVRSPRPVQRSNCLQASSFVTVVLKLGFMDQQIN